jgi:hypothetical protein
MSSEESLPYNGPFSTYLEWHAAILAFVLGAIAGWSPKIRRQIRKEPAMAVCGLLAGVWAGIKLRDRGIDE